MPKPGTLAYECRTAFVSTCLQIVVALACVLLSLWIASLLLEWLNLLGISTVPPGIRYADFRRPPFIPAEDSTLSAKEQLDLHRAGESGRRLLPRFAAR